MPFQLVQIWGQVEPIIVSKEIRTWDSFEGEVIKYLKKKQHNFDEDGLFFIELAKDGKFLGIFAFTQETMDALQEQARKGPRDWSPRDR